MRHGNVYTVTVQASDGTHTAYLPVTVTVTDVNEGPEVMGPAQFSIAENQGLHQRNRQGFRADWRFTTEDARIKLKSLYPSIQM